MTVAFRSYPSEEEGSRRPVISRRCIRAVQKDRQGRGHRIAGGLHGGHLRHQCARDTAGGRGPARWRQAPAGVRRQRQGQGAAQEGRRGWRTGNRYAHPLLARRKVFRHAENRDCGNRRVAARQGHAAAWRAVHAGCRKERQDRDPDLAFPRRNQGLLWRRYRRPESGCRVVPGRALHRGAVRVRQLHRGRGSTVGHRVDARGRRGGRVVREHDTDAPRRHARVGPARGRLQRHPQLHRSPRHGSARHQDRAGRRLVAGVLRPFGENARPAVQGPGQERTDLPGRGQAHRADGARSLRTVAVAAR